MKHKGLMRLLVGLILGLSFYDVSAGENYFPVDVVYTKSRSTFTGFHNYTGWATEGSAPVWVDESGVTTPYAYSGGSWTFTSVTVESLTVTQEATFNSSVTISGPLTVSGLDVTDKIYDLDTWLNTHTSNTGSHIDWANTSSNLFTSGNAEVSGITVNASISFSHRTESAAITLGDDYFVAITNTVDTTVTLPSASTQRGRIYNVANIGTNDVNILLQGGDSFSWGGTNFYLYADESLMVISDGSSRWD